MREGIRKILLQAGASAVGFSKAGKIDSHSHGEYEKWIGEGRHGEMGYLQRHIPLREDTCNVLPEAKTVISLAFDFTPETWREKSLPYISSYAYGCDYHEELRKILRPIVKGFKEKFGGEWRICIDSAPLAERFWAIKSDIGVKGINGAVIADGCGAMCFLAEILTTLDLIPEIENPIKRRDCKKCMACVKVCPSGALEPNGMIDARKCINYLTIEKKGEFSPEELEIVRGGRGFLFGCDLCLKVCPEGRIKDQGKREIIQKPEWLRMNDEIKNLTPQRILELSEEEFNRIFKNSPLRYAGYDRLCRNARALLGISE